MLKMKSNCPQCGLEARTTKRPWDEVFTGWFVGEIFGAILLALLIALGNWWYLFAVLLLIVLVWAEAKRPKKYHCKPCDLIFTSPPIAKTQSNKRLQTDAAKGARRG